MVKNLFGLFNDLFLFADAYTQVALTRLTPTDKMQLLLKPYIFNSLDLTHSIHEIQRKCFVHEKRERVWMTLIHFVVTN